MNKGTMTRFLSTRAFAIAWFATGLLSMWTQLSCVQVAHAASQAEGGLYFQWWVEFRLEGRERPVWRTETFYAASEEEADDLAKQLLSSATSRYGDKVVVGSASSRVKEVPAGQLYFTDPPAEITARVAVEITCEEQEEDGPDDLFLLINGRQRLPRGRDGYTAGKNWQMTKGKTITVDLWKGPVKNEQLLEMTVAAREDDEGNPFDDNEEFGEFGIKVWNSGDVLKATIEAIATATLQGNAQVVLKGGDGGQYRFRLIVEKTQPEITRTSRATAGEKKRRALKDALRPVIPPTEGGKNSRARDTLQPDAKAPHEAPLTHEKKVEWFTVEYRKRHGTVWNVLKMSALWREMYGEEMPDYHDILP